MKIRKVIYPEPMEVEISVSTSEIADAITSQDGNQIGTVQQGVNGCAQYLKAIPDALITEIPDSNRKIIGRFLREQAARFESGLKETL
jgi:hypothetical protein